MVQRDLVRLHEADNVLVLLRNARAGEPLTIDGESFACPADLALGHKLAARAIQPGEKILKYGASIGSATRRITRGDHVHLHNMKSDYKDRRFDD